MYIVKRKSRSGGAEYLVRSERGNLRNRYRWDKVAKVTSNMFKYKVTAMRNAEKYQGSIERI